MTQSPLNVAVTGALTPVGREILKLLAERSFPLDEIFAVQSGPVAGEQVSFGEDDVLDAQKLDTFDFAKTQLIIHAGKADEAERIMKLAIVNKAKMVDLSGAFITDEQVPVVVVDINDDILEKRLMKNTVSVPSAAATILALALNPLNEEAQISNVTVTVFDPAVTGGRGAMDEVFNQTKAIFMNGETRIEHFPKQIAFNAIPMVGGERDDDHTGAEYLTMMGVSRLYNTTLSITHVSVPIFTGMSMSVTVMGANKMTAIQAALKMTGQGGIGVSDETEDIPTPAEIGGEDLTYVARLRGNTKTGLQFWLCADSIRRGQAMNAVQVAEALVG